MSSKAPVTVPEPQQPAVPQNSALEQYVETNFRNIIIAFVAIVVVAAVSGVVVYQNHRAAEAAAIEGVQAKTVEDCDLVVQHHSGTVAAGNALLTKAKLLWEQNKKDTAVATLRDFVAKYSSHPFISQGTLGLASRLESMGAKNDLAEAKALYEKIVAEQPKSDIGTLAQMRLGDMLWNEGKPDEAKKVYESLPQKMTGSPFFEHNEERLKWLAAGLPTKEVEGPKPPPDSIKAPAAGALPGMNLNSSGGSPLGNLMNNLKAASPDASIKVDTSNSKPIAVPAPPKPGVVTPGAALPVPGSPKGVPAASAVSAPVQVPPATSTPAAPAPAASTPPVAPAPSAPAAPAPATTPVPEKK